MSDDGRSGREALTGVATGRKRKRGGEQSMVPDAEFASYYGKPVLNEPVWRSPDIPGYLFLGGLAGASSLLGAGAHATGRPGLAVVAKSGAAGAIGLSLAALIHDLGRPARFLNMLRVLKVTSPMSVGSWLLAGYVPLAGTAALSALTGKLPRLGALATAGSTLLGPAVAAYTAPLICDTAVPSWHDGYREMPYVFTGSGAAAAGGLGLLAAPASESTPARNLAVLGAAVEVGAMTRMKQRLGMVAEPYHAGTGGAYLQAADVLTAAGVTGALFGRGVLRRLSGAMLVAASGLARWGIFHAGKQSAADPKYTVVPQRERLRRDT